MKTMLKANLKRIWLRLRKKSPLRDYAHQQEKFANRYPNFTIGRASYGMPIVYSSQHDSTLKIGAYCSIANNVQVLLGGQHRIDWVSSYPFPFYFHMEERYKKMAETSRGDVIIGNDVWLCANTTILSGVTIGDGAVIASGAVISRDVEPYAVMAGNPAKLIKWRFDEETREALLASKWWNWPEEEIIKTLPKLCSDDTADFINYSQIRHHKS